MNRAIKHLLRRFALWLGRLVTAVLFIVVALMAVVVTVASQPLWMKVLLLALCLFVLLELVGYLP